MGEWRVIEGDALTVLRELEAESVQTCVTSPPYFGLRDYRGGTAEIGTEATSDLYVSALVRVFDEVWRVLREDGTLWCNLGDLYGPGKQLLGVPWRAAFALQARGWCLRSEIIWAKRNGLPDGSAAYDRPDRSHEHIFLLSKRERYFYDAAAIREDSDPDQEAHNNRYARSYEAFDSTSNERAPGKTNNVGIHSRPGPPGRNRRSVWTTSVARFDGAHFAVFPPNLIEPCILAGSREGDTVLDPFAGAGTTGLVATRHGRGFVGVELNPAYAEMARQRIRDDAPLMNYLSEAA